MQHVCEEAPQATAAVPESEALNADLRYKQAKKCGL